MNWLQSWRQTVNDWPPIGCGEEAGNETPANGLHDVGDPHLGQVGGHSVRGQHYVGSRQHQVPRVFPCSHNDDKRSFVYLLPILDMGEKKPPGALCSIGILDTSISSSVAILLLLDSAWLLL